jgi:4-amino-4-deoxy-L-arabinose transferase-like glycosyltransferase
MTQAPCSIGRPEQSSARPLIATRTLAAFALTTLILHLVIAGRYGWFRDELYYIDAGKHLSGGYVDFPMMVALLADLQRAVFGTSLTALHVLPPVAGACIIILTALMAREMGGGLTAQRVAGLSALVAPAFIGADALFTMDAFDQLWWTLGAFILLRLLTLQTRPGSARDVDQAKQRLWLLLGLVCGLGLLTKLTILGFGLVVAAALRDPARRELLTPWPYLAGLISFAFLVPYAAWEVAHGWPTLTFWNNYGHTEDPATFLIQVVLLMQPLALPLWLAGLWYLLRNPAAEPYRPVGWTFLTLFILFLGLHAKSYFLVPAFPPLLAAGAVALERQAWLRPRARLVPLAAAALVLGGIVLAPVVAPILPPKTLASVMSSPIQPVADRFGWPQFVGTVSAVYHRLPASQRRQTTILAGNYGEAGALDLLGPADHLPRVISPHNTYYFWDQGVTPGRIVIATDFRRSDLLPYFSSVRQAAITASQDGIQNEEVGRSVYICRGLKMPWSRVWPRIRNFS